MSAIDNNVRGRRLGCFGNCNSDAGLLAMWCSRVSHLNHVFSGARQPCWLPSVNGVPSALR